MLRLTSQQIEEFASRKGAKRIAVENFLCSLFDSDEREALMNLHADARSYGWNAATIRAIHDGIKLASKQ